MAENPQIDNLVNQAIGAFNRGYYREAAGFANQVLALDYTNPQIWPLLHRLTGSQKSLEQFREEFTRQYFPHQVAALQTQAETKADQPLYPAFLAAYAPPIFPYPLELMVTEKLAYLNLVGQREAQFQLKQNEKGGHHLGEFTDGRNQVLGRVEGTVEYESLGCLMSMFAKQIKSINFSLHNAQNALLGFVVKEQEKPLWLVLDAARQPFARLEDFPYGLRMNVISDNNIGLTVQSTRMIEQGTTALYYRLDQFGNTGLLPVYLQELMLFGFLVQLTHYAAIQITFAAMR